MNNGKTGELNVADYKSNGGLLSIDVDPSAGKADELHIHGDASGHTKLLVHAEDASKPEQDILFAKVDGKVNDATFDVWRVYGSPYDWETSYNSDAQEWYLNTAKENPALAAEMMGYIGLQSAGFEVNRNLLSNVQNKVAANTLRQRYYRGGYTRNCIRHYKYSDVYVDENYRCDNVYNAWVSPIYSNVKVRDKADYNADIRGLRPEQIWFQTCIIGLDSSYHSVTAILTLQETAMIILQTAVRMLILTAMPPVYITAIRCIISGLGAASMAAI